MQRVEEKMRMKLHLERLQLRAGQLRFETRVMEFFVTITPVIVASLAEREHEAVEGKSEEEISEQEIWLARQPVGQIAETRLQDHMNQDRKECADSGGEQSQRSKNEHPRRPVPTVNWQPVTKSQDQRDERNPDDPTAQVPTQRYPPFKTIDPIVIGATIRPEGVNQPEQQTQRDEPEQIKPAVFEHLFTSRAGMKSATSLPAMRVK